jgi:hypothetical protein
MARGFPALGSPGNRDPGLPLPEEAAILGSHSMLKSNPSLKALIFPIARIFFGAGRFNL